MSNMMNRVPFPGLEQTNMAKKKQQRLAEKRARILDTAKEVLKKHGRDTTMADVAAALGMDSSALYYYYKSISEILDSILNTAYHDFSLSNARLGGPEKSPLVFLEEMMLMLMEFYYDNIEILQIILAQVFPLTLEPGYQDDSVAIKHFLDTYWDANDHILRTIRLAQDSGELTREVTDHTILQTLRGYIFGLWSSWKNHTPPRDSIAGFVNRFFLMYRCTDRSDPV